MSVLNKNLNISHFNFLNINKSDKIGFHNSFSININTFLYSHLSKFIDFSKTTIKRFDPTQFKELHLIQGFTQLVSYAFEADSTSALKCLFVVDFSGLSV
jgi:hypothetical protein